MVRKTFTTICTSSGVVLHYINGLLGQIIYTLAAYQKDLLVSEHAYYQVSLEASSSACPAVSCYRLTAEHRSKRAGDRLVVDSSGRREGPW